MLRRRVGSRLLSGRNLLGSRPMSKESCSVEAQTRFRCSVGSRFLSHNEPANRSAQRKVANRAKVEQRQSTVRQQCIAIDTHHPGVTFAESEQRTTQSPVLTWYGSMSHSRGRSDSTEAARWVQVSTTLTLSSQNGSQDSILFFV